MSQVFARVKDIHFKIDHFALRDFDLHQFHRQDLALELEELVVFLVHADDDVVLADGAFPDGVDGVEQEILADVVFVIVAARLFLGLLYVVFHDVRDVRRRVGDIDRGLAGLVDHCQGSENSSGGSGGMNVHCIAISACAILTDVNGTSGESKSRGALISNKDHGENA